jgi:hypothetical protein
MLSSTAFALNTRILQEVTELLEGAEPLAMAVLILVALDKVECLECRKQAILLLATPGKLNEAFIKPRTNLLYIGHCSITRF